MKPEDNNPVNDHNLNTGLDSIEQVYRQATPEEPPDLLDQAILNKARQAAEVKKSGWYFGGFRWLSAFATASVVVVALALVMEQTTRVPDYGEGSPAASSRPDSFEVDVISADDANEIIRAEEESLGATREVEEFRAKQSNMPEPKVQLRDATETPRPLRAEAESAQAAAPLLLQAVQERQNDSAQLKSAKRKEDFSDRQAGTATNRAALQKTEADADQPVASTPLSEVAAEPAVKSQLEPIIVSGSAMKIDPLPPEEWIKNIMRWKHMQLNERFEKEFAEFRKVYPDYELPDELKKLVRE